MSGVLCGKHPNTISARAVLPPYVPRNGVQFDEGPEVPIVRLLGDDDDAQVLTVTVVPVFEENPAGGEPHRFPLRHGPCVAVVEWGTGAVACFAEVDIGKGTCFNVAASSVVLKGRNDGRVLLAPEIIKEFVPPVPAIPIDPEPGPLTVVGSISGYGTRAAFGRATRTYYRARLSEAVAFPVPPFAKSVLVSRVPISAPIAVSVRDGFGAGTARDGEHVTGAGAASSRIQLLGIADAVVVSAPGLDTFDFVQVQFELAV